jgi:gamma-glutamylcyclotransferase (GGCT)/AIG2-like uncharacterized protein YtfP
MADYLFVYGTLRNTTVQKQVFGKKISGTPDILENFKKSKIEVGGEEYPIIIPSKGSSVEGLILPITAKELKLADEYETKSYRREKVVLKSGKTAWAYQSPTI